MIKLFTRNKKPTIKTSVLPTPNIEIDGVPATITEARQIQADYDRQHALNRKASNTAGNNTTTEDDEEKAFSDLMTRIDVDKKQMVVRQANEKKYAERVKSFRNTEPTATEPRIKDMSLEQLQAKTKEIDRYEKVKATAMATRTPITLADPLETQRQLRTEDMIKTQKDISGLYHFVKEHYLLAIVKGTVFVKQFGSARNFQPLVSRGDLSADIFGNPTFTDLNQSQVNEILKNKPAFEDLIKVYKLLYNSKSYDIDSTLATPIW